MTAAARIPARGAAIAGAAGLLLAAYVLVVLAAAWLEGGGHWRDDTAPVVLTGDRLEIARGSGHIAAHAVVVDALDPIGLAIVSGNLPRTPAERYPRVAWHLRVADPAAVTLTFLWRTQEAPNRTFSKRLAWTGDDMASADLDADAGWRGNVVGVALAIQRPSGAQGPLVVETVTLPSVSVTATLITIAQQWTAFFPFRGNSINIPFDEERNNVLPLLVATAMAQGLAALAYVAWARRRRGSANRWVLAAIFTAGWLVLDLRWEANLLRQLSDTARVFSGKSSDDKHRAEADHALFDLMQQVNAALPPPPARILLLSDHIALRTRGAYFLYPHNVYHASRPESHAPMPSQLHAGDYVLLALFSGLGYDRAGQRLVWPDGGERAVDEVLVPGPDTLLLRVR